MAAMIVNHRVEDFDRWLPYYEAHGEARGAAGVTTSIVWQAQGDPNNVFILMKGASAEAFHAFTQSEDLKATMQQAGVVGAPTFSILEDGRKYPH